MLNLNAFLLEELPSVGQFLGGLAQRATFVCAYKVESNN